MLVVALRDGHFGGLYRFAGEEFEVPDDLTGSWFKPVGSDEAVVTKPAGRGNKGAGVTEKVKNIGDIDPI